MNNLKVPDYMKCLKRLPTLKSELSHILQPLENEYNQLTGYEEKIALVDKIHDIVNSHITKLLIPIVSYENSTTTTNDPYQDTLYAGKMRKARDMAYELHGAHGQKELLNCRATAQLEYVNQEISKRGQGIIYPQELRAKFIDIFNEALTGATKDDIKARIEEDRKKFIDNQDEMLNCRAVAQLNDINKKIVEIEKDEVTIFPTLELLSEFMDAFDQALYSSTKTQTVFRIIEDREKFIDDQVSKIKDTECIYGTEETKKIIIELIANLYDRYPEKVKSIFTQNGITQNDLQKLYNGSNEQFKIFISSFEEIQIADIKSSFFQKLYLSDKDSAILESIIGKDAEGRKLLEEMREFITSIPEKEFLEFLDAAYIELEQESKDTTKNIETPNTSVKRSFCDFDEGKTDATDEREIKKAKLENVQKLSDDIYGESIDDSLWLENIDFSFLNDEDDTYNLIEAQTPSTSTLDPFADVLKDG